MISKLICSFPGHGKPATSKHVKCKLTHAPRHKGSLSGNDAHGLARKAATQQGQSRGPKTDTQTPPSNHLFQSTKNPKSQTSHRRTSYNFPGIPPTKTATTVPSRVVPEFTTSRRMESYIDPWKITFMYIWSIKSPSQVAPSLAQRHGWSRYPLKGPKQIRTQQACNPFHWNVFRRGPRAEAMYTDQWLAGTWIDPRSFLGSLKSQTKYPARQGKKRVKCLKIHWYERKLGERPLERMGNRPHGAVGGGGGGNPAATWQGCKRRFFGPIAPSGPLRVDP